MCAGDRHGSDTHEVLFIKMWIVKNVALIKTQPKEEKYGNKLQQQGHITGSWEETKGFADKCHTHDECERRVLAYEGYYIYKKHTHTKKAEQWKPDSSTVRK